MLRGAVPLLFLLCSSVSAVSTPSSAFNTAREPQVGEHEHALQPDHVPATVKQGRRANDASSQIRSHAPSGSAKAPTASTARAQTTTLATAPNARTTRGTATTTTKAHQSVVSPTATASTAITAKAAATTIKAQSTHENPAGTSTARATTTTIKAQSTLALQMSEEELMKALADAMAEDEETHELQSTTRQIIIKGERQSSVGFVTALVQGNYPERYPAACSAAKPEPTPTTYCCWSHGYASSKCSGFNATDPFPLHVFVLRSPYPWALAMHAHENGGGSKNASFSEFIRSKFT